MGGCGGAWDLRRGHSRFSFTLLRSRRSRCANAIRSLNGFDALQPNISRRDSNSTPRGLHITGRSPLRDEGIAKAP